MKMANDRHCGCSSRHDQNAENERTLKMVCSDKMTSALGKRIKRTQVTFGIRMSQIGIVCVLCVLCVLVPITYGQMVTRDPRFYSREGDLNYQWPNPGDPEYR